MGERRNRKSFWDTEDGSKHVSGMREHNSWAGKDHHSSHGSGRYRDLSDSRATSTRESRDHSEWPPWESIEDPVAPMSRSFKNTYERKDVGGDKRYHKNIPPVYEEMEIHNYNHSHEYDRSHSQRYVRKGRSRSRSRTHGRSQSRSLSRGRERERERGRGWSRSRSRSRSDGYGYANAHRSSRSPIGDYRRQPYGWSDKRSGQEKLSQTCRDFAYGRCRKGSQCRFFHPDSVSRRDGEFVEDDRLESWRGRSDHGQISRHTYTRLGFESRNDMSDLYHGEDERYINRSRTIPCRDFKIGNCRWGDACKFSHDDASAESFGRDTRNTFFDKDFDHQQFKNEKPLCKFFAAGRCNRDNCRFSHDDPNLNTLEGRLDKVNDIKSSRDKNNWRNAPEWDDATRISDAPMPAGWGDAIATNSTSAGDISDRDYSRFSHDDRDLNKLDGRLDKVTDSKSYWWNAPKWDDATRISDAPMPTGWGEAIATNTTSAGAISNRDYSRFSHDDPNLNNLEGRLDKVTDSKSSHDKSYWRNAPNWDDATGISDAPVRTGWGEAIATNTTGAGDTANMDYSRLSCDDSNLNSLEGRLDKVTDSKSSHENNRRNAPKWDDATRISDAPMPTGCGEAISTNTASTCDITDGQSGDKWGFKSKDDNKIWGIQEWASKSLDCERQPSLPRENGSYGADMGPANSFTKHNTPHKQDQSHLQNKDWIVNLHGFSALQENRSLNVPPAHFQQQQCGITSNPMSSCGSTVLDEVKDTRYTNHSILLFGQSVNQNDTSTSPGHSSVANESDRGQNMLYTNLSNGLATDLNQPETHMIKPLNVQIPGQNDKNIVRSPSSVEARVPQILINLLTNKLPDKVSNSQVTTAGQQVSPVRVPVSLPESFVNEHSQTSGVLDASNSRGMLPSLSCVNTSTVQDNAHAVSLDQFNSMGNGREYTEPDNLNLAQATDNQNNQMQGRSSSLSILGTVVESSNLKHPESPGHQGEMVAKLDVPGDGKSTGEESKGILDNRPCENLDSQGKLEDGSANKDEKGMRLFKNSLVELVKEILKPIWKEGRMSRDVHKTVVKKVVDKVSCTIQAEHIPKTQDKVDLYLSSSKPKITRLVQAYVDRSRKPDA